MLIGFLLHVLVELDPPRFNDGALGETEDILLALGFYIERLKYRRRCGCSYAGLEERSAFHFLGVGGFLFCLFSLSRRTPADTGDRHGGKDHNREWTRIIAKMNSHRIDDCSQRVGRSACLILNSCQFASIRG